MWPLRSAFGASFAAIRGYPSSPSSTAFARPASRAVPNEELKFRHHRNSQMTSTEPDLPKPSDDMTPNQQVHPDQCQDTRHVPEHPGSLQTHLLPSHSEEHQIHGERHKRAHDKHSHGPVENGNDFVIGHRIASLSAPTGDCWLFPDFNQRWRYQAGL